MSGGRILLPDYGDREIKMTPLAKAVYLLFLRHPMGIKFKCLPDHRNGGKKHQNTDFLGEFHKQIPFL